MIEGQLEAFPMTAEERKERVDLLTDELALHLNWGLVQELARHAQWAYRQLAGGAAVAVSPGAGGDGRRSG